MGLRLASTLRMNDPPPLPARRLPAPPLHQELPGKEPDPVSDAPPNFECDITGEEVIGVLME